MVKEAESAHPREVTRSAFMELMPANLRTKDAKTLRQLCPMDAKAYTNGSEIKRLLIHHFTQLDKDEVLDFTAFQPQEDKDTDDALNKILEQEFDEME